MNQVKKYAIPLGISVIIIALLIIFRTIPVTKLWNGYTVLSYASKESASVVENALNDNGVSNFIMKENQKIPSFRTFASVLSLTDNDSYTDKKQNYFFDKAKTHSLVYIPDQYKSETQRTISFLKTKGIIASLDVKTKFPWVTPLVALIVALIFLFLSTNKIVYALCVLCPIIFAWTKPFYINAASVCISLFAFFVLQKVWRRKSFISYTLKNPYVLISVIAPIILSFTMSFQNGALYILSLFASVSLLYALYNFETEKDATYSFCPIFIRPASYMKAVSSKSVRNLIFPTSGIFVLILLLFLSTDFLTNKNQIGLFIPSPVDYNNRDDFPILTEYVEWKWKKETESYKSLNEDEKPFVQDGDEIVLPRYEETVNGIREYNEVLFKYDDAYRKKAVRDIDLLDYPAIEKMLKHQGHIKGVDYVEGSKETLKLSNFIILIISMFVPIFMALYFIITNKRKPLRFLKG